MVRNRRYPVVLSGTLLLAGCQGLLADLQLPAAIGSSEPTPPGIISDQGTGLTQGAALTGTVLAPAGELIGNNAAQLIGTGPPALLSGARSAQSLSRRAQALLAQAPVAGAQVSLLTAGGSAAADRVAATDAQGRYRLAPPSGSRGPFFVRARFAAAGKTFDFLGLAPASGAAASADVDVASTLVSHKLLGLARQGQLDLAAVEPGKLRLLVDRLRDTLEPGLVPFMAETSPDIVPAFDQIVLDRPELRTAAADLAPRVVAPLGSWTVSKALDSDDLIRLGVYQPDQRAFSLAGAFEVDAQGNYYFPTFAGPAKPISIVRVRPGFKETSTYAELPPGVRNPVSLAFSPDGLLHAVAVEEATARLRVYAGRGGTLEPWRGDLGTGLVQPTIPLGRPAFDGLGALYLAIPFGHYVTSRAKDDPPDKIRIFAGDPGNPGYADGALLAARFNFPRSLARGPSGMVAVADQNNGCIRQIAPDGNVTTLAGKPGEGFYRSGRGAFARFGSPSSLVFGALANIFIVDTDGRRIRRLSPDGSVFLVAGSGLAGVTDGPGEAASFNVPLFLAADGSGSLYVLDAQPAAPGGLETHMIRKITPPPVLPVPVLVPVPEPVPPLVPGPASHPVPTPGLAAPIPSR